MRKNKLECLIMCGLMIICFISILMMRPDFSDIIYLKTMIPKYETKITTKDDYDKIVNLNNVVVVKKTDDSSVVLDGYTKITFDTQAEREKFLQRWEIK